MNAQPIPSVIDLPALVKPQPKQKLFLETIKRCCYVLYGGAAGGGKSYILRWFAVICILKAFLLHGVRGAKFGLFCETFPALKGRHLSVWNIPKWLGEISDSKTEGWRFKLKEAFGGGMVMLYNLDDPAKYDSEEFIGIAVDEWCKNPWSVFDELRKRLRWPAYADEAHLPCGGTVSNRDGVKVQCPIEKHSSEPAWNFPFALGSNPGGKSHAETKAIFVDGDFKNFPHLRPIKDQFAFVRAVVDDNVFNPADYKAKNLDTLPGKLRQAYADGDWNVFVGQYFSNFDKAQRSLHPAIISALVKPWWKRWMSSDWGFNHHWVTQWHCSGIVTVQEAKKHLNRDWTEDRKVVITYREVAERQLSEIPYSEMVCNAMPKGPDGKVAEHIERCFLGFDAFGRLAKNGDAVGQEIGTIFQKYGLPRPSPADDARVPGWRLMYSLIERDEWFISSDCESLLNAIPVLKHREDKTEDVEKVDNLADDEGDCARYGLKSMLEPEAIPEEKLSPEDQEAWIRAQKQQEASQ